jgi:hypothetical protein
MSGYITYEVKVDDNGDRSWWLNGERHREDGPAYEYADGNREWYLNGQLHRGDGPAIEWADGDREWWFNEQELSEEEHANIIRHTKVRSVKLFKITGAIKKMLAKVKEREKSKIST